MSAPVAERAATVAGLRRDLGTWGAISIVVGIIIGTGIFLVPRTMIRNVGSPAMLLAVWVTGAVLTLCGTLTYSELAAAMPEAGGEYVFLREAYGPLWGFLYGWTQMWVAKSGALATIATGFFYYLANFRPELDHIAFTLPLPGGPDFGPLPVRYGQLLAMALILAVSVLNSFGVKLGGRVQIAVTAAKVALIVGIIVAGLGWRGSAVAHLQSSVPVSGGLWAGFFAALVAALWAYDGWNNVSMVSAEIKNPQRNLPVALIAGTLLVVSIYLLINVAYFLVLPARDVAQSERVAAEMLRRIFGPAGAAVVSVAAMVSIFATLNGATLASARVPYAMARDGLFFRIFGRVDSRYATPSVAILGLGGWGALLVLSGTFEQLATYVIFSSWLFYGMTGAAVFILRRKRPDLSRPYRVLFYPVLPAVFVLSATALVVATLIGSPRESLFGIAIIALGLPFYWYWERKKRQPPVQNPAKG